MGYTAYAGHGSDFPELKRINSEILTNAVGTCEIVCPNLRFFTLQTGGKAYGVEFHDKVPYDPPLSESLPRIPEPYRENIFYYEQYDILKRASENKPWTFCEIRPDAIVGFVPQNNAMNIAQALGLFLSLWRDIEGEGSEVRFPGSSEAWRALHTDTSQDILARFHIYASLHPTQTTERAFNVVDGPATTWEQVWPEICVYFGLKGIPPESSGEPFNAAKWMEEHQKDWSGLWRSMLSGPEPSRPRVWISCKPSPASRSEETMMQAPVDRLASPRSALMRKDIRWQLTT